MHASEEDCVISSRRRGEERSAERGGDGSGGRRERGVRTVLNPACQKASQVTQYRQDDYTSTRLPLLQLGPRRKARGPTWKRDPPRSRPRDPSPLFNLTPATEGGGDARPAPAPGQAGGRGGVVSESRQAPGPPGPGPAEPPLPHVSRRQRYTLLPPSPCSV